MSSAKQNYLSLVPKQGDIPIFLQPWWLDAVVENHEWDVVLIEDHEIPKAFFIYVVKRKGPFTSVGMPGLTSFLGFWFANGINQKQADELLAMLPKHDKFYIQMSYGVFGLNLANEGFNEQVRHTYVLSGIKNHEAISENFKQRVKGEIKKADGRIKVRETSNVAKLYTLCEKSFQRQGKEAEFTINLVQRIYDAATANNSGTILLAEDEEGNAHAATLVVWDQNSAYYLLNGGDPELRSSGANSLLMWETIKYVSKYVDTFDFEGSMIPGVEKYIQGYNPEKKEYSLFTKTNSKIVAAAEGLKKTLGK